MWNSTADHQLYKHPWGEMSSEFKLIEITEMIYVKFGIWFLQNKLLANTQFFRFCPI